MNVVLLLVVLGLFILMDLLRGKWLVYSLYIVLFIFTLVLTCLVYCNFVSFLNKFNILILL